MRKLLILLALILLLSSCSKEAPVMYKKSDVIMYTTVSITVIADSPEKADSAIEAAFDEIRRIEQLLSFWTEDSEIARINKQAGVSPVAVSADTLEIIETAMFVSEKTEGAFDPTIGPVIRQWNFKQHIIPEAHALSDAAKLVDYKAMNIDRSAKTAYLGNANMSFDTGGIAKGFAADKAVAVLKQNGIKGGLVAVAGDIRAFGHRADGAPWKVGIRDPRPANPEDTQTLIATLDLDDMAISTSGDYERFFFADGKRYHHILDPRTGYPAEGSISATVIAPKAVLTDGFSTGIFILGPEKGIRLLESLGFDGVIVDSAGKTHATERIKKKLTWLSNNYTP